MPLKRKLIRRARKVVKRAMSNRRTIASYRAPHQYKVVNYEPDFIGGNTTVSDNNIIYGVLTFKLSDLPNANEFTALYDLYKIDKVNVEIIPAFNSSVYIQASNPQGSSTAPYNNVVPMIHTVIDYNDATHPTDINTILQNSTYKSSRGF